MKIVSHAVILSILAACIVSCSAEQTRAPAVAGQFYPGNPEKLLNMVDRFISSADKKALRGKPVAFIVPHAGYVFSGAVAGHAYTLLKDNTAPTVLIIGIAHRYPLQGASVYREGSFETPLGTIPVNETICKKLIDASPLISYIPEAYNGEHSIEVQLPFLQRILPNATIVPILIGNPSLEVCRQIGEAIAHTVKDENIILLASTDMSHYPSYKDANRVDQEAIAALKTLDPEKLHAQIQKLMLEGIPGLSCVFCGEGAAYTVMYAAKALNADTITILKYANSGDVPIGKKDSVVGYLSAVFTDSGKGGSQMKETNFSIKPENQKILLQVARKSITTYLTEKKLSKLDPRGDTELESNAAIFITLTKKDMLRGCIGTTEARYPLIDAVNQFAVSAAFEDHRFPPVDESELSDIHIEISVLSPLKKITNPSAIKTDVHGVVVEKGSRSGLFLPQVWEHFPGDKDAFMGELCAQKAGLPRDAWKKDKSVNIYTFTVFKFEEEKNQ